MDQLLTVLAELATIERISAECVSANLSTSSLEKALSIINDRCATAEGNLKAYLAESSLSISDSTSALSAGDSESSLSLKEVS